MANAINTLRQMSVPPSDRASYDSWLKLEDVVGFLKENIDDDQFVLHATLPNVYMNSMLVPLAAVEPPNVDDLMSWNCTAYSGWSVIVSYHPTPTVGISGPLDATGSVTLDEGEQLLFAREFQGRIGQKHYFEILQKFLHVSDLHYLSERGAYCRFDRHGDIEEIIRVIDIPPIGEMGGGAIVTVKREVLDRYATLRGAAIVRTFDFTRFRLSGFGGWRLSHGREVTDAGDLFYRLHIEPGNASYIRGFQIIRSRISQKAIIEEFHPASRKGDRYVSFIAYDWKNRAIAEISCAPGATANYFTSADLPFEVSPAFFRPEVLSKYKADSDKYRMSGRNISCRGAWSLQTYDINEAGQVHTYLIYLRNLPYEEQLHWRAHNEAPKATISRRAYLRDFEGSWEELYDPLESVKEKVGRLRSEQVPWWTLSREDAIDRTQYPLTASADEWANEILHLDQLIVEPFKKGWFKAELLQLGKTVDPKLGALILTEECFVEWGQDSEEAKQVIAPLRTLHDLRSKLKGHLVGMSTLTQIQQQALIEHGSYKEHFRALCQMCDRSLEVIAEVIAGRLSASAG